MAHSRSLQGQNLYVEQQWRHGFRWCREVNQKIDAGHLHILSPRLVSHSWCGSEECNAKTNWICRPQSSRSVSHSAESPTQIPPKSPWYPARSHTHCSPAYLLKPANIRSLLQGSLPPPCFMSVLKFTISLSALVFSPRLPLSHCHCPPPTFLALSLSFHPPLSDWTLNYINSNMSEAARVCRCHPAFVPTPQRQIPAWCLLRRVRESELILCHPSIRSPPSPWLMRRPRATSWSGSPGTPRLTSWSTSGSSAWPTDRSVRPPLTVTGPGCGCSKHLRRKNIKYWHLSETRAFTATG